MVEIKNLSLSYALPHKKNTPALDNINVRFEKGKISAIIGPSGCGKTSLVKIMAGLIKPAGGEVFSGGVPVRGVRKNTSVIFQDYGLLPWKTVRANAELPLQFGGRKGGPGTVGQEIPDSHREKAKRREKVAALLSRFGLAAFAGRYPHQLSGGMKQRLAIVRALAIEPELLLMDEPFSSLDALSREEAQDFLLSVQKEHLLTVIMVTHSVEEAVYLADSVFVMNGVNPGSITERVTISRDGVLSHAGFRGEARFQEYCGALRRALLPVRREQSGELP